MFDKLTFKQKLIALAVVAIMLGLVAYKRSFKLTIEAYSNYNELSKKVDYINQSSSNITELDNEINFYNALLGDEEIEPEFVQQEILSFVSEKAKGVKVFKLEEIHEANQKKIIVYTNQLTLQGSFNDLLTTIYEFEKDFSFSRVANVSFYKKKESKTKEVKLYANILFQNYKMNLKS